MIRIKLYNLNSILNTKLWGHRVVTDCHHNGRYCQAQTAKHPRLGWATAEDGRTVPSDDQGSAEWSSVWPHSPPQLANCTVLNLLQSIFCMNILKTIGKFPLGAVTSQYSHSVSGASKIFVTFYPQIDLLSQCRAQDHIQIIREMFVLSSDSLCLCCHCQP